MLQCQCYHFRGKYLLLPLPDFFFFLGKDAVIYTETTKLKALGLATQPEALQESRFSVTGYCLLLQVPQFLRCWETNRVSSQVRKPAQLSRFQEAALAQKCCSLDVPLDSDPEFAALERVLVYMNSASKWRLWWSGQRGNAVICIKYYLKGDFLPQ